jgi:ribosome-associated protein
LPLKAAKKKAAKKQAVKKPAKKAKAPARKVAKKPAKTAPRKTPAKKPAPPAPRKAVPQSDLLKRILTSLDDDKAEDIVTINLEGRSALCDAAVIASGRSSRHVGAMAEHLARRLKESGYGTRPINGQAQGDWVLVDAGDVIVHLFRPEVRDYYDLEGMWSVGSRK